MAVCRGRVESEGLGGSGLGGMVLVRCATAEESLEATLSLDIWT